MRLGIFHSVNAGLFFWDGERGLWVDGIHDGHLVGFSPMPGVLRAQMEAGAGLFAHTDALLFTHLHQDHFDAEALRAFPAASRGLPLYGPGLAEGNVRAVPLGQGVSLLEWECGAKALPKVLAMDTVHDGASFRDTRHQSLLIRMGGEQVFVAGDAILHREQAEALAALGEGPVAAGFFNLYQLVSKTGRAFMQALAPQRVFLYHLPFAEDDVNRLRRRTGRILGRSAVLKLPPVEVPRHMAWVDGDSKGLADGGAALNLPALEG